MLVFTGIRRLRERSRSASSLVATLAAPGHDHDGPGRPNGHRHAGAEPAGFWGTSGAATSIAVGVLHGIGAETPTQVLLLAAAATAGGAAPGIFLLGAFLVGLFLSNSLVGLTVALGFLGASRNFGLYATVSVLTGFAGMAVGLVLLTGKVGLLPTLFAG